jgi:hypothetical protein
MDPATAKEIQRQKKLQEQLATTSQINALVLGEFICRKNGAGSLEELQSKGLYGNRPEAWTLMMEHTAGVELGSVKRSDGQVNKNFVFCIDTKEQDLNCLLSPNNTETCRFLDDPRIPESNQWVHPFTGQKVPGDLSKTCIYNSITRHVWSSFDINIDVSMGYIHTGIDALHNVSEFDKCYQAAGGTKGGYMTITKTKPDGNSVENISLASGNKGVTNPDFVKTMALLNEKNVWNGIIKIPFDVCKEAGLPVYNGPPIPSTESILKKMENLKIEGDPNKEAERMKEKMQARWEKDSEGKKRHEYFVLIPVNHVLAWPLRSQEYRISKDINVEMFTFNPRKPDGTEDDPVLLYFIVANPLFEAMMNDWNSKGPNSWLGKVDMRPLNEVSFKFTPQTDRARYNNLPENCKAQTGVVALRTYITYSVPPVGLTQEAIDQLAPTLSPGFLPASAELTESEKKDIAVERYIRHGI